MVKDGITAFKYSSFLILCMTLWHRAVCVVRCVHVCAHVCVCVCAHGMRVRGAFSQIPRCKFFPSSSGSGTAAVLGRERGRMLAPCPPGLESPEASESIVGKCVM